MRCASRVFPERQAQHEDEMTLEELRERIDVLDRQLVELLSERARAALMIGHLKVKTSLPIYEPAREKIIYANVRAANKGPLPDIELTHIYERIIDVMRALQRNELASERNALANATSAAEQARVDSSGQGAGAPQSPEQRPARDSETPETGKTK
jgi:chorismate mutase